MSEKLIESIIDDNLVEANDIFRGRMKEILECKLYEAKRMMAAEAFGGMTKDEIEARKKAGYIKAADFFAAKDVIKKATENLQQGTKRLKRKKKVVTEAAPPLKWTPAMRRKQMAPELGALKAAGHEYAAAKGEQPTKTTVKDTETTAPGPKPEAPKAPETAKAPEAPEAKTKYKTKRTAPGSDTHLPVPVIKAKRGIERYREGLRRAREAEVSGGKEGRVARYKKKIGLRAMPSQALSGFSILKGIAKNL